MNVNVCLLQKSIGHGQLQLLLTSSSFRYWIPSSAHVDPKYSTRKVVRFTYFLIFSLLLKCSSVKCYSYDFSVILFATLYEMSIEHAC